MITCDNCKSEKNVKLGVYIIIKYNENKEDSMSIKKDLCSSCIEVLKTKIEKLVINQIGNIK